MPEAMTVDPCVLRTVPTDGTLRYCDILETTDADGRILKWPHTCYRATVRGELPTHFPHVRNGNGEYGFVVSSPNRR